MTSSRRFAFPSVAILAAGLVLIGYLILLIGTAYLGQSQLQGALSRQLATSLEKKAYSLGYFFAVWKGDLAVLASDPSLQAYLANGEGDGAKGSPHWYGKLGVRDRLLDLVARRQLDSHRVFRRVTAYGADLRAAVDTRMADPQGLSWEGGSIGISDPFRVSLQVRDGTPTAYVQGPVVYGGTLAGLLVGEVDLGRLLGELTAQAEGGLSLIAPGVVLQAPLGAGSVEWKPQAPRGQAGRLDVKVPGTPFRLAGTPPLASGRGGLGSPWLLAALALLSVPVLLGIRYLLKLNERNLILNAQFEVSRRQRKELHTQNKRLSAEIARRREYQRKLSYQANFDSLTDLPNRNLALDRLAQEVRRARREDAHLMVGYLDLDHFKHVNDTLGHAAGDQLLIEAAQRLRRALRDSDTVARLGGDEFLAVCFGVPSGGGVQHIAEALLQAFEAPFRLQAHEFFVTTSLGVALFPGHGESPQELMRSADIALYRAKEAGRTRFCVYDRSMEERENRRLVLERHLRRALDRDEMSLAYQPIVELESGRIVAAEALLRWNNQVLGPIPPEHFIPLAEDTGLIHDLGEWALRRACAEAVRWESDPPLRVAVNLSPVQFRSPERLVDVVERALDASGLPPERLTLEITENVLLQAHGEVPQVLEALGRSKIRISGDDFGTGFSSLSYLHRFAFDELKIDRSFVQDVPLQEESAEVVRAILAMAQALSLDIVAEGVENAAQVAFLLQYGCRFAQGFHWGGAMAPADFAERVRRQAGEASPRPTGTDDPSVASPDGETG